MHCVSFKTELISIVMIFWPKTYNEITTQKKNTGGEGKLLEMIHVSAFPLDNWLCQN